MPRPVLIHPGFHKTGTTYLQEVLFADNSQFHQPWPRQLLYQHIIDPHELAFDGEAARRVFAPGLTRAPHDAIPVLSEEGLCGNPFNGARESGVLARKLRSIFDDARIVLTVRRQPAMLRAVYIQYLKAHGRRNPEAFYHPPHFPEFAAFDPDVYQYHRLAECYAALFGSDCVVVLPQELLQHDEDAFIAALARLIGADSLHRNETGNRTDRNVSPSPSGIPFLRFGNRFFESAFNETAFADPLTAIGDLFRRLGYRKTPFFKEMANRVEKAVNDFGGRYRESNARLQAFCPVDLSDFGYEMPKRG